MNYRFMLVNYHTDWNVKCDLKDANLIKSRPWIEKPWSDKQAVRFASYSTFGLPNSPAVVKYCKIQRDIECRGFRNKQYRYRTCHWKRYHFPAQTYRNRYLFPIKKNIGIVSIFSLEIFEVRENKINFMLKVNY